MELMFAKIMFANDSLDTYNLMSYKVCTRYVEQLLGCFDDLLSIVWPCRHPIVASKVYFPQVDGTYLLCQQFC